MMQRKLPRFHDAQRGPEPELCGRKIHSSVNRDRHSSSKRDGHTALRLFTGRRICR